MTAADIIEALKSAEPRELDAMRDFIRAQPKEAVTAMLSQDEYDDAMNYLRKKHGEPPRTVRS